MDPPDFINEDSFSAHSPRQESTAPLGMPGQSQGPAAQQQSPAEAAATAGHGAWPASPMRAASGWLATPKSMVSLHTCGLQHSGSPKLPSCWSP